VSVEEYQACTALQSVALCAEFSHQHYRVIVFEITKYLKCWKQKSTNRKMKDMRSVKKFGVLSFFPFLFVFEIAPL
jgi:hypothetical protein